MRQWAGSGYTLICQFPDMIVIYRHDDKECIHMIGTLCNFKACDTDTCAINVPLGHGQIDSAVKGLAFGWVLQLQMISGISPTGICRYFTDHKLKQPSA